MNASTYLKLAEAARQFVKRDDIFQAMDAADNKSGVALNTAIGIMPEVIAETAVLALNLTRCAIIEAFQDPETNCTNCKKPKVSWKDQCSCDSDTEKPSITQKMLQTGSDVAP